jgi:endonuclease/exonuclease/phosphatase family metal-dependent hydrolase
MSRRERVVRAVLAVLVIGVLVGLVVRDVVGGRSDDPSGSPSSEDPTASPSASSTGSPTEPAPGPTTTDQPGGGEDIPEPPEGLEDLVCAVFREPVDLRVLSFNTHHSTGSVAGVAAEIDAVQPDIALLQEVDRFRRKSGGADQAALLAEALDMEMSYSANLVRGRSEYGTLILSRFPIVQEGRFTLPGAPGVEPRGLQWVTLDVAGRPVRVFNTHLDAVRPRSRLQQAQRVADVVARETVPLVLGGDLNAWPTSGTVATLTAVLTDTWTVGTGRAATGVGGRKIDYLFVGGALRPVRSAVALSGVSDHHRLWADVRLRAPRCPDAD